jgi:hypothetical protein
MFKKENCAQKQQIIIAWFGIGKLAEVIKTNLGDLFLGLSGILTGPLKVFLGILWYSWVNVWTTILPLYIAAVL